MIGVVVLSRILFPPDMLLVLLGLEKYRKSRTSSDQPEKPQAGDDEPATPIELVGQNDENDEFDFARFQAEVPEALKAAKREDNVSTLWLKLLFDEYDADDSTKLNKQELDCLLDE
eukprot:COSAG02_NODE_46760_length_346_cov_0.854251_1_plen_115_part_11